LKLPNIWCKLSGIFTEADRFAWTADDLSPYVRHVVDLFGYNRLMFGSDWPVCTLAGTCQQVVEVLRQVVDSLREHDARSLWGATAPEV